MNLLLTAMLFLATVPADASASGAPRLDALVLANAYGDTVWFESDTLVAGSAVKAEADRFRRLYVRTSANGVVLMIGSDSTASPPESPGALVERLAAIGFARRVRTMFPAEVSPAVYESSRYPSMRWTGGWDLPYEARSRPPARMTFVVVGKPLGGPTAGRGPDGAPVPIVEWRLRQRIYDLSSAEMRATARVVGDVIVDFDRRLLMPLKTKGTTVARLDKQTLGWR